MYKLIYTCMIHLAGWHRNKTISFKHNKTSYKGKNRTARDGYNGNIFEFLSKA